MVWCIAKFNIMFLMASDIWSHLIMIVLYSGLYVENTSRVSFCVSSYIMLLACANEYVLF